MTSPKEVPETSKKREKEKFTFVTESAQKRRKKQRDIARVHLRSSTGDAIGRCNIKLASGWSITTCGTVRVYYPVAVHVTNI